MSMFFYSKNSYQTAVMAVVYNKRKATFDPINDSTSQFNLLM